MAAEHPGDLFQGLNRRPQGARAPAVQEPLSPGWGTEDSRSTAVSPLPTPRAVFILPPASAPSASTVRACAPATPTRMRAAAPPGCTVNTFSMLRPRARSATVTPGHTSPKLTCSQVDSLERQRAGSSPRNVLTPAVLRSCATGRAPPPRRVSVRLQPRLEEGRPLSRFASVRGPLRA